MESSSPDARCTSERAWSWSSSTGSWRVRTPSPRPSSPSPLPLPSFSSSPSTSPTPSPSPLSSQSPPPSLSSSPSPLPSPSSSIWSVQKKLGLGKVREGTIVLIPKRGDVDPKSIVHLHQDFTARGNEEGGFNHPAVVIDILPGDILRCLQVTSFAGQGADAKWHQGTGARKRRALYLEIDHSNKRDVGEEAAEDNGRPILRLCNRHTRMCQASFVNCERSFCIESLNVFMYRNGNHRLQDKDLDRIQAYRSELFKQSLISDNTCSTSAPTRRRRPEKTTPKSTCPKYRQI